MRKWLAVFVVALLLAPVCARADEYKVEAFDGAAPDLDKSVADKLAAKGFKILKDDKSVWCEVWPVKELTRDPSFDQGNPTIIYPMLPGSLVGAVRFPAAAKDIRAQNIPAGVYTLRYILQPENGSHVGTFDTRDFLVMLPASKDKSPDARPNDEDGIAKLVEESQQSIQTAHPAVLGLLKQEPGKAPIMHQRTETHWWSVLLDATDEKKAAVPLEVIVVGTAEH